MWKDISNNGHRLFIGAGFLFIIIQDPLEHLIKIQGAIYVNHEHINFRLLEYTGIYFSCKHYRNNDSYLYIQT